MADQKITQLTEDTTPTVDDLIPTVDAPGGSAITKKVTISNLATLIKTVGMLNSKIITASRDMTALSGDVSYTGAGFIPTAIIAMAVIETGLCASWGFSDSAKLNKVIERDADGNFYSNVAIGTDNFITIVATAGNNQQGVLKTYDADGFTITWNKIGTPTGIAQLIFLCFR